MSDTHYHLPLTGEPLVQDPLVQGMEAALAQVSLGREDIQAMGDDGLALNKEFKNEVAREMARCMLDAVAWMQRGIREVDLLQAKLEKKVERAAAWEEDELAQQDAIRGRIHEFVEQIRNAYGMLKVEVEDSLDGVQQKSICRSSPIGCSFFAGPSAARRCAHTTRALPTAPPFLPVNPVLDGVLILLAHRLLLLLFCRLTRRSTVCSYYSHIAYRSSFFAGPPAARLRLDALGGARTTRAAPIGVLVLKHSGARTTRAAPIGALVLKHSGPLAPLALRLSAPSC
ncbi:hypothetical protein B0H13DRAFT_2310865 [Mycena leptocephala]|nr:hypothetical protein B0H13DRAFT_2310865 [Mycena leptocephala]